MSCRRGDLEGGGGHWYHIRYQEPKPQHLDPVFSRATSPESRVEIRKTPQSGVTKGHCPTWNTWNVFTYRLNWTHTFFMSSCPGAHRLVRFCTRWWGWFYELHFSGEGGMIPATVVLVLVSVSNAADGWIPPKSRVQSQDLKGTRKQRRERPLGNLKEHRRIKQ